MTSDSAREAAERMALDFVKRSNDPKKIDGFIMAAMVKTMQYAIERDRARIKSEIRKKSYPQGLIKYVADISAMVDGEIE